MHRRLRLTLLSALCLGSQAWAGAEASNLRYRAVPDPNAALTPIEIQTRESGLPLGWRFTPYTPAGAYPSGPSSFAVSFDPVTGKVLESYREGDVEVREPLVITPEQYNRILSDRTVRKLWRERTRGTRSVARGQGRSGSVFAVDIPVRLPKLVQSIVGDGAPRIEVSGSESISLSGSSDWTASDRIKTERRGQSIFPSLEMKQELNVNLTGSIGDKIKVDVDQSSNVVASIDNKVKLRYEGDDDDMIRSVELGNTNLSVEGASFRQEGLFGIKTVARLGNLDLVTIVSKQEGKTETARFTPSGENKRVIVSDLDYIRRTYFLIADRPLKITPGKLKVYKDDLIGTNNNDAREGLARLNPAAAPDSSTNPERAGNFTPLQPITDYTIETRWIVEGGAPGFEIPVLKLQTALGTAEVLAVAYEDLSSGSAVPVGTHTEDAYLRADPALAKPDSTLLLKMIKPPLNDFDALPDGRFDTTRPWYKALFYELRNFYDLGGRDISFETLNLKIRRTVEGQSFDPDAIGDSALTVVLGLDQRGRPGSADPNRPDGTVDDQYIDPQAGILFFPDLHPFAPDTIPLPNNPPCAPGYAGFHCLDNYERNKLRENTSLPPESQANPNVYYVRNPEPTRDQRFYIDADFKSSQQGYFLGRFDILENSEQVKVDGIPQRKGIDYNVDYATGQLTFVRPPGPNQTISVDFSFAPGIGATQLTLLGASASYIPGPNFSASSSFLYDSRGAMEKNPKLGEEPARSMIGDLSSTATFRPVWMTQLANLVPGVRSNSPSTLNIQGHASFSVPDPNTAGEAYIDDMDGNRESNTVGLSRPQWFWSSLPVHDTSDPALPPVPPLVADHNRLEWYNARGVKEGDLKPILKKEEGMDNEHTVLELNIKPPTGQTTILTSNWTGVTQSLSSAGQDFSKLKFLEIWVNDFTQNHSQTQAKLHLDFGRVSEDAFWSPDSVPNGQIDTEDKNDDGRLDRDETDTPEGRSRDEDTGLDGLHSVNEPGYDVGQNLDPHGDDYPKGDFDFVATKDYSRINNMERNGTGEVNARPDTEDLNRDGYADFKNDYFEATIDLATDTMFVAIDVARDYAGIPVEMAIKPNNGWRLFRIPISDEAFRRVNSASWENIQHMRIWVNGMSGPLKLQIGGIELVGNRWLAQAIDSTAAARGVSLLVGSRNNKDDADIYTPPYDVENAAGGTAARREQSLALRYDKLTDLDSVFAFKTTSQEAGGLGWTQYGQVRFWVHGEPVSEISNLRVLARFGPDTVNYYEYSAPVKSGWQSVVIPMELLSGLKDQPVKTDSTRFTATGELFRVVGNPSFTRILRLSFGVTVQGVSGAAPPGEIWINDLRLSAVRRDRGMRGDVTVQANFADVLALNVNYQNQDEDFFRVGGGVNQGTGVKHVATGLSTTFQLGQVFPMSGIVLPIRVSLSNASDVPKFRTGSDVILSGSRSDLETRKQSRQSFDLSYRRTGPQKGLARYTIDALSGDLTYTRSGNINATSIDSSWLFRASSAYSLPLGGGGFSLGQRMRINPLPERIGLTMVWNSSRDLVYGRKILEDRDSTELRSDVKTRLLTLSANTSWTPLSSVQLRFTITSLRNMLLHQQMFGFNKGTEIDQARRLELSYQPRWLSLFSPNVSMSGRYHESSRPELRILGSDPVGLKNVDNAASARATAILPLGRFAQMLGTRPGAKPGGGIRSVLAPLRVVLSRFQDVQGSFIFERGTVISRVTGDAGFLFETGFTEARDPKLLRAANSNFAASRSYASGASTTIRPASSITVDLRGDHRLSFTDNNLGARRTLSLSFPDLKGHWLDLQKLLGLQNTLSTMSLNSSYNLRREESGQDDLPAEVRTNTTNLTPLLGWDLVWKNGLRAYVNTHVTQATTTDQRVFGIVGDRRNVRSEVRFTKIYPASRGIRFPWSKKPLRLPNDLNLNLTFTSQSDRRLIRRPGQPDIVEQDETSWRVGSQTNYNFTQTISGGFNLELRQRKDQKTDITTRGMTLGLNANFRF